jgi:hypothetical protein
VRKDFTVSAPVSQITRPWNQISDRTRKSFGTFKDELSKNVAQNRAPVEDQTVKNDTTLRLRQREVAKAVAWVRDHGDLVDFPYPDNAISSLFRAMHHQQLIVKRKGFGLGFLVTGAGLALLEQMENQHG